MGQGQSRLWSRGQGHWCPSPTVEAESPLAMPGCGCAGANVPAGWLRLWGGLGGQQDRSCLTAAAISCPQHPAPGSERFCNTRARKGNSEAMPGKWGKSPCCVLCPGSCDELSTVSAWFGLSLVRSQPIVGAAKPPSAPHLGAVAPNETRGKAGRGRASPEQTPFANMGCGQDPGSGQGWPWHWAGSRARQQERQGFPHPACGIARAPSLGTLGIIPPLGLSSLGVPGVFGVCAWGGGCMLSFHSISLQRVRMIPTPKRPQSPFPDAGITGACPTR